MVRFGFGFDFAPKLGLGAPDAAALAHLGQEAVDPAQGLQDRV
jgi:hypothetical protein